MPDLRCLMLTSFTSDEAMLDAILAGASGYVVKDIKGMELAQAIKDVGAGRSLLDNRAAAALMAKLRGTAERSDPLSGLTEQEKVLLDLLGEGLTNKQIACANVPRREDRQELRLPTPGQAWHGAAHAGRSLRIEARSPRLHRGVTSGDQRPVVVTDLKGTPSVARNRADWRISPKPSVCC